MLWWDFKKICYFREECGENWFTSMHIVVINPTCETDLYPLSAYPRKADPSSIPTSSPMTVRNTYAAHPLRTATLTTVCPSSSTPAAARLNAR